MYITCIRELQQTEPLRAEWEMLANGVPMLSPDWLLTWWKHYGQIPNTHRELFVLAVLSDDHRLLGLAPWFVEGQGKSRTIQFLGCGEVCSDHLSILANPEHRAQVIEAITHWLWTDQARKVAKNFDWYSLDLNGGLAGDASLRLCLQSLKNRGALTHLAPLDDCWRIELPATWPDYLAILSKSHRKQVNRCDRRYFETGRAVFKTVGNPVEWEQGFSILVDLHQRRWQAQGLPGCFASRVFHDFHREVSRRMLESGRLRLSWVEFEGRPIAAEYHFCGNEVIYAYQSGTDPDFAEEQPGRLAMLATIKAAIESGCHGFDLLRGNEPYKAHWRATPSPMVRIRVANQRLSARVRHRLFVMNQQVRAAVRGRIHRQDPAAAVEVPADD